MAGGAAPVATAKERDVRPPESARCKFPRRPLFCVGSSLSGRGHQIKNHVPQRIKPQSDTYHDYSEAQIDGGGGMIHMGGGKQSHTAVGAL